VKAPHSNGFFQEETALHGSENDMQIADIL